MQYPKISIIIPSYKQGEFIEDTLLSIINQNYPNLEILVIDGGSNDNTLEIIKKYEKQISYWVSEPDRGQSHAINKGLVKATGDWLAFMNSDDGYWKGALNKIFSNPQKLENIDFIYGNKGYIGKDFKTATAFNAKKINPLKLYRLMRFFNSVDYIIPSQSVFISRKLYDKVGGIDENLHLCMDLDWYLRIAALKPKYYCTPYPTYFYRLGDHTKTDNNNDKMYRESIMVANRYIRNLNFWYKSRHNQLIKYDAIFRVIHANLQNIHWNEIFKALIASPYDALTDTRFLGIIKRKLK